MTQPVDAQGGERLDFMMGLYGDLAQDAVERDQRRDDWYFLSERVLRQFKYLQGVPETAIFTGTPVEQAYWIWRQTPRGMMSAIMEANGVAMPPDLVQRPGAVCYTTGKGAMVFLTALQTQT